MGFLDDLTAIEIGKSVDTLTPTLSQDGYRFGYWTAGDTRLADSGGRSLTTASVLVEGPLILTAHYFPEDQDTDNDEVPDWFEYRNFGDLNQTGTDDPDEDGFSNNRESQLGQEATIHDLVEDGGSSFCCIDWLYLCRPIPGQTNDQERPGRIHRIQNQLRYQWLHPQHCRSAGCEGQLPLRLLVGKWSEAGIPQRAGKVAGGLCFG